MTEPTTPLRQLIDFVNTRDVEASTDELSQPAALTQWLRSRSLLDDRTEATTAQLQRAVAVREGLRAVMLAHHDGNDAAAADQANQALARVPLRVAFAPDGEARLVPAGEGVDAALAALVAVIPPATADGTWQRAKICPSDSCQWAFYDQSRNRSRRWCSMEVCGNREKSRTFRSRHDGAD